MFGLLSIDVQAGANLRFFEFAEIAINAVETFFEAGLRWVEVELAKALLKPLTQQFAAFTAQLDGLPIFINEPLQFSQGPMQPGASQRWSEVIED